MTTPAQEFKTPQEEIEYWKNKFTECQGVFQEFKEFRESSHELEQEYDTQIRQLEKKSSDSKALVNRLEAENEQLKSRYNCYVSETQHKLNDYHQRVTQLNDTNNKLTNYIRELEQTNDDLERAKRTLLASVEDFELQLNQQIERNVLLENEINGKDELECLVQRLKEETRDLHQELQVKASKNHLQAIEPNQSTVNNQIDVEENHTKKSTPLPETKIGTTSRSPIANDLGSRIARRADSSTSPSIIPVPRKSLLASPSASKQSSLTPHNETKSQQIPLTSSPTNSAVPAVMPLSSRLSALNIIGELLRKVGALESRLASVGKITLNPLI